MQASIPIPAPRTATPMVRWMMIIVSIALVLVVLIWLPWQIQRNESMERQQQLVTDTLWVEQTLKFQLEHDGETLQLLAKDAADSTLDDKILRERFSVLLQNNRELSTLAYYDANANLRVGSDPYLPQHLDPHLLTLLKAVQLTVTAGYLLDTQDGHARLLYVAPVTLNGQPAGAVMANFSLEAVFEQLVPWWFAHDHEIVLRDLQGLRLASRAAGGTGKGYYSHRLPLTLPGVNLTLSSDSIHPAPPLLPSVLVGSVMLLTLALLASLWALWRDVARRIAIEHALRDQVRFSRAMENSLLTGLRARDLEGRITYVNRAFCDMVGYSEAELLGQRPPLPYWAPESMDEYQQRLDRILAGQATPQFETVFRRSDGQRLQVLVLESPLVDEAGQHAGWMGSILDISDRKRAELLAQQQQEKLEAGARLSAMGELASILAHELNQPLAAMSSYASGISNILEQDGRDQTALRASLKDTVEKIRTQAQRAGQIIRSVHAFVRKRDPVREPTLIADIVANCLPLIELQARRASVRVHTDIEAQLPAVLADHILIEQVLLNLTRNAIEAMHDNPPERRRIEILARHGGDALPDKVVMSVIDLGHGIDQDVASRLYSPFFSTKSEGMGMGLSLCRTTIEFHHGALEHAPNPEGGTIFTFTLPVAGPRESSNAPARTNKGDEHAVSGR